MRMALPVVEDFDSIDEGRGREKVNLGDSEDFIDSQESEGTFAKQVGVCLTEDETESQEEETRRSKRLRDREDRRPQEMAMERKEAQNAFVHKGQDCIPSIVNEPNVSLLSMASLIGVNLECAIESVDSNLNLIKDLENARINLFLKEKEGESKHSCESKSGDMIPEIPALDDIFFSEDDDSELDKIDFYMKQTRSSLGKKKHHKGNLEIFKVTPKLPKKKGRPKSKYR